MSCNIQSSRRAIRKRSIAVLASEAMNANKETICCYEYIPLTDHCSCRLADFGPIFSMIPSKEDVKF